MESRHARLARCPTGWWPWSRVPCHLQALCAVHFLTGICTIVVSAYVGPEIGGLFLGFSCLVVVALIFCTSGAFGLHREKGAPKDLEVAVSGLSAETGQLQAYSVGELGNPKLHSAVGGDHTIPSAPIVGEIAGAALQRERSEPLPEAEQADAQAADSYSQCACQQSPADCLVLAQDASVLDCLRNVLAHHLKQAEVSELSASQAELLEHHLLRLASYSEKIIHTIAFAQRVFVEAASGVQLQPEDVLAGRRLYEASQLRPAEEREEECEEELAPPKKAAKKLRLDDDELLKIFTLAQREAELEADWRGIHFSARGRKGLPPLILMTAPGLDPVYHVSDAPPSESDFASARAVPESGKRKERQAAIGLLGQAFIIGEDTADLAAASEDLAQRLVPVQVRDDVTACCLPMNGDSFRPSKGGHSLTKEPFMFRVPDERDGAEDGADQSLGFFGAAPAGSSGGSVLSKESTDLSQSSASASGMVQAMPVLSDAGAPAFSAEAR